MVLRAFGVPRAESFSIHWRTIVWWSIHPLLQRGSTNGGAQAQGRRDGKELFYIALNGRLMAVSIRIASTPQTIEAGSPVPLFATRVGGSFILSLQPAIRRLSRWPEVPDRVRCSNIGPH